MDWFETKQMLTKGRSGRSISKSVKLSEVDERIASKIEKFQKDEQALRKSKQRTRYNITRFYEIAERIKERSGISFEVNEDSEEPISKYLNEIKEYEKVIEKQVSDIVMILQKLKLLVRNEYDDLVMDVKNPLLLFQEFCNGLSKIPQKLKIDKKTAILIRELLKTGNRSVTKEFNKLVNTTIKFIENDFKYYEETELALQAHLKRRTTTKRQIIGKITWISKQLRKVEEILNRLSTKTQNQSLQELSQVISYFRAQFEGLINFSLNRIQVANYTIIEALVLEKDYLKELKELEGEIERFYGLIFQQEEKLRQSSVSRLHKNKTRISGKISEGRSELANIKKELKNQKEAEKAEKKHLEKRIKNTEVQESSIIREERKEAKKALKKVSKLRKAITITILSLATIPVLSGFTGATYLGIKNINSGIYPKQAIASAWENITNINVSVIRNAKFFLKNPIAIKQINEKFKELSSEFNRRRLTDEEIQFVKNIMKTVATGGYVRAFGPPSLITSAYAKGKQIPKIELPSKVYREARHVREAERILIEKIKEEVEEGNTSGLIKTTDEGVISEKNVFLSQDGEHKGQINANGILVSPIGGILHYTDNSYPLWAHYKKVGSKIHITFEIPTQKYDYQNSPKGARSRVPTPSGVDLVIPDDVLGHLEKIGAFYPVEYGTHWDTEISV